MFKEMPQEEISGHYQNLWGIQIDKECIPKIVQMHADFIHAKLSEKDFDRLFEPIKKIGISRAGSTASSESVMIYDELYLKSELFEKNISGNEFASRIIGIVETDQWRDEKKAKGLISNAYQESDEHFFARLHDAFKFFVSPNPMNRGNIFLSNVVGTGKQNPPLV
ncbi:MAG: hypothetical protein WC492_03725 [Candidatus Micrarchaeia archaeon]